MNTLIALAVVTLTSSGFSADPPAESITAAAARMARDLAQTAPVATQTGADDAWNDVRRLPEGTRIRVIRRTGAFEEGRVSSVSSGGIALTSKSATAVGIARDDVAEVRRAEPSWVGGLAGVAAGGVAGLFVAMQQSFRRCPGGCLSRTLIGWGALVGMPIAGGYLGSRAHVRWTTVYRAR